MENWILVAALSLDTLFACVAYGAQKIRIPFRSAIVIAAVGMLLLQVSLLVRAFTDYLFPERIIRSVSFAVLIAMGMLSLFQSLLKAIFHQNKTIRFCFSELSFVLNICIDETKADSDSSKLLSVREAVPLALALSADSLLTGFSITADSILFILLSLFSFCMGLAAVTLGTAAGNKITRRSCNLSWVSGLFLIVIAFLKIL